MGDDQGGTLLPARMASHHDENDVSLDTAVFGVTILELTVLDELRRLVHSTLLAVK